MPTELKLTRQEVSNRRRSPWRRTVRQQLEALGPNGKILRNLWFNRPDFPAKPRYFQGFQFARPLAQFKVGH